MKTYEAKFYRNGILEDKVSSSVDWEIRRFIAKYLPGKYNSIAVFAFMKGDADAGTVPERVFNEGGGWIGKLTLERKSS